MEDQQELMYKLQMFEQHMQQMQQQLQAIEQGIVDLGNLNLGLDELVGKKDKEVMTLIGKGIFAKTKLLSEELIVDVGGKNFVTKSIPETKEMIVEQIGKLDEAKKILTENMENTGKDFEKMLLDAQNAHENSCGCEDEHGECGKDCNCEEGEEACGCGEDCKCEKEEKKSDALEDMVDGEEESSEEKKE